MKKLFITLATLAALAVPTAMQAFDGEGAYAGGIIGANWVHFKGHSKHRDSDFKQRRSFDTGWLGGVHVGYRFCGGWRVEGEVSYRDNEGKRAKRRHNDLVVVDENSNHRKGHKPNLETWSFMVNGLYEISNCWCITPYVGLGIGYDDTEIKGIKKHHHRHTDETLVAVDGNNGRHHKKHHKDESGFAWQILVGGLYPIDDCLELGLEYRFHHGKKDIYNNAVDLRLNWFF